MGLKGIKSSALRDFWQLSKLLLFNFFQDVKYIRLMVWPRLELAFTDCNFSLWELFFSMNLVQ